jgi:hypothetical protein
MSTGVKTHRITDPNDDTRFVDVDPYVVECTFRAMAFMNGQGNGFVGNSYTTNVSSVTENATGDLSMFFTNNFADGDYEPLCSNAAGNDGYTVNNATRNVDEASFLTVQDGSASSGAVIAKITGRLA